DVKVVVRLFVGCDDLYAHVGSPQEGQRTIYSSLDERGLGGVARFTGFSRDRGLPAPGAGGGTRGRLPPGRIPGDAPPVLFPGGLAEENPRRRAAGERRPGASVTQAAGR